MTGYDSLSFFPPLNGIHVLVGLSLHSHHHLPPSPRFSPGLFLPPFLVASPTTIPSLIMYIRPPRLVTYTAFTPDDHAKCGMRNLTRNRGSPMSARFPVACGPVNCTKFRSKENTT